MRAQETSYGWLRRIPDWRDLAAIAIVLGLMLALTVTARQMMAPWSAQAPAPVSLAPGVLPSYALRTVLRMLIALLASLLFSFLYAAAAARSVRAERVLIPLLDVLQSVPILGYLSFTVLFFVRLFPGSALGPECAAIFAIFTSQAWNMAFSVYQSLRTLPRDLTEAARACRFSAWQRFWRLEAPFAVPGLVWNMMMSMSGAWFFVVAAEAFSVGEVGYRLPGIGSYVAIAIEQRDLPAIGWAVAAMAAAITLLDQLLFRPLVAWAERFRAEQAPAGMVARSTLVDLLRGSRLVHALSGRLSAGFDALLHLHWLRLPRPPARLQRMLGRWRTVFWYAGVLGTAVGCAALLIRQIGPALDGGEAARVMRAGAFTWLRVALLMLLASLVWVPAGIAIGNRPRLSAMVQPLAQFLAAFPANLLFPLCVAGIVRLHLDARIWLTPLMLLGTQWYLLFNVVAGASAFPADLRQAADSLRIRGERWWRKVMLPGVFPFFVTGAVTAAGGAWNASIVAEAVSWGSVHLDGDGLGAYIARMTAAGDYPRIALGVATMSLLVVATNRLIWRPLYRFAENRTRLD